MISFHFGISIGTTSIANRKRKDTLLEDYKLFVLVGTIARSKTRSLKNLAVQDSPLIRIYFKLFGNMDYLLQVAKLYGYSS